jgi:hypothetical protein
MSADTTLFLKLMMVSAKEGALDWSNFESPAILFSYIQDNFGLDPSNLDQIQKIYIGEVAPDLNTIWFNNGPVPFVGLPIGGQWHRIYQVPPNSPFICLDAANLAGGVRQVTSSEVTAWGLPVLSGPSFWAILDIDLPATS